MNKYAKQDRGNISAYESYFAAMDASMQQKIALTTAHFPAFGKIADMGSGSGRGTYDLATLYERLILIGADINPVSVEQAASKYKAKNLSFTVGDISEKIFPDASLDGILNSSVLHHVTSFNDFDVSQITKTLKNQVAQLKKGGVIIIRDFVVPDAPETIVLLDLPTNDGKPTGEISELSSANLFEVFAADFRSSLNRTEGVKFEKRESPHKNFARFAVTMRTAAEFVLRKDYRTDWHAELLEEYTYFSQDDFEKAFRAEGLRIVVSMPLWNPWILENRFVGKFRLSNTDGKTVIFPPTNYLIVGEKVSATDGVLLRETEAKQEVAPKFLQMKHYRQKETGQIYELVERPHRTLDILPWFEDADGQLFVLAKKDFPRPIVNADVAVKNLNRAVYSGYLTEPLSAIDDTPQRRNAAEPIAEILAERAGLKDEDILEIGASQTYFTSPGGIDEKVESFPVKIKIRESEPLPIENYTPFKSAGLVRELDALQVLRSAHVGGMFDARLEINIYRLLRHLNRTAGSWIGASVKPLRQSLPKNLQISSIEHLTPAKKQVFTPLKPTKTNFLEVRKAVFSEFSSAEKELARHEFEYVVPQNLSKNTVTAIPFFQAENEIYVGLEFRDLPAVQRFTGSSRLICVPAWRLPKTVFHKFEIEPFLHEKFPAGFAVSIKKIRELGGSYFTSPGVTPEVVYPTAVELKTASLTETSLQFFRLQDLITTLDSLQDAHLLISANRLAHALGKI